MELSEQDTKDFSTLYNYLNVQDEIPERADAIIVGGEWLRSDAADRVFELYSQGVSDVIIFSGYAGFEGNTTGESEAKIMAERAMALGVPKSSIILEERASNTAENLTFSSEILAKMDIVPQNIVLVHKPYMTRRFKATALAQWPQPQPNFYVTSVRDNFDEYMKREQVGGFLERTLWSMPGDYKRIVDYTKKGWQTGQPTDKNAQEAYERLQKKFSVR
jgi:uncharacterized SAM-binding protein YcdF (DUF218 family)